MAKKRISLSVSTTNGAVRQNNEDNFSINGRGLPSGKSIININGTADADTMLLAVFDGMGGEEMGEVASAIASRLSGDLLRRLNVSEEADYPNVVNEYVNAANTEICRALSNDGSKRGGTTMALVYLKNGIAYPFSLGDSRIYLLAGGSLVQISEDHTLAMRKYKANIYTLEEAEMSSDSHKLTLFLGVDVDGNGLEAQWYDPFSLRQGSKLLICSDGLYDMLSRDEIHDILMNCHENTADELAAAAFRNGGIDNITCIVAQYV